MIVSRAPRDPACAQVAAGSKRCMQVPEALHASLVQRLLSSAHAVPTGWNWQAAMQHESGVPFVAPASHCSPGSRPPLPHVLEYVVLVVDDVLVEVLVLVEVGATPSTAPMSMVPPTMRGKPGPR